MKWGGRETRGGGTLAVGGIGEIMTEGYWVLRSLKLSAVVAGDGRFECLGVVVLLIKRCDR